MENKEELLVVEYKIYKMTKNPEASKKVKEENEPNWDSLGIPNPNKKEKISKEKDYDVAFEWRMKTFFINDITTIEDLENGESFIELNYDVTQGFVINLSFEQALKTIYKIEQNGN